ncbi:MAG TPA: hypothetical protein VGN07_03845 [Steroidobacteraceae bacterium]|jgi:hypothetical protein
MSTLIFTVAQNGYGVGYSQCVQSHAAYAKRVGAKYLPVVRPFRVKEPALSAWLKIPLMLHALRSGYEWVAFVDADCRIHSSAPDFRAVEQPGRSVYMANGRSGRVNSGVMFAKAAAGAAAFFEQVMGSLTTGIPPEDRQNLRYENGNVIYCTRHSEQVEVIDHRWNNTYEPGLQDHFRHYTGPLRGEYRRSLFDTAAFWVARSLAATPTSQPEARDAAFVQRLADLTATCVGIYPVLSKLHE